MMQNYISVIITVHNRLEYYEEAISSVLSQNFNREKYEVIVVHYTELPNYIKEDEIRYIKTNEINVGSKLHLGLKYAKGDIIVFLEDDDYFFPDKLQYIYEKFSKNKNLVYIHNDCNTNNEKIAEELKYHTLPWHSMSCISIRKSIILDKLDYLKNVKRAPDLFIYLSALDSSKDILISDKKLTFYRIHDNNFSRTKYISMYYDIYLEHEFFHKIFRSRASRLILEPRMSRFALYEKIIFGKTNKKFYIWSELFDKEKDLKQRIGRIIFFYLSDISIIRKILRERIYKVSDEEYKMLEYLHKHT